MKNKPLWNAWLNILTFIIFLPNLLTSLILKFSFEEDIKQKGYQLFWGISRKDWVEIHEICGILLLLFIFAHLLLHLPYIKNIGTCLKSNSCKNTEQKSSVEN